MTDQPDYVWNYQTQSAFIKDRTAHVVREGGGDTRQVTTGCGRDLNVEIRDQYNFGDDGPCTDDGLPLKRHRCGTCYWTKVIEEYKDER